MFKVPAVVPPNTLQLSRIAENLGFDIPLDELEQYKDAMAGAVKMYDIVDSLPDYQGLPVRYPRLPGQFPKSQDNPYNAWYIKTDIAGASTGLMAGKTVAIKDNIPVAGVRMMAGSKLLEGYVPDIDATVVTRILDAGGHIVGKSTCEDLCFSGSSFNCTKGPVPNPHDQTRCAGGSSSGSAVLVQVGEIDVSVGTDQAGSIRIPCSWTGVVGFKPTYGLVPYTGIVSIDYTIDTVGPISKTVKDCALMLEVIAGRDSNMDSRQPVNLQVPSYSKELTDDLSGLKVGILSEGYTDCEVDVQHLVHRTVTKLSDFGAKVDEVSVPEHFTAFAVWMAIDIQGAYETMIKGAGFGVGFKGYYPTSMMQILEKSYQTQKNDLSTVLKYISMLGEYMKQNYGLKFYAHAQNLSRLMEAAYDKIFEEYDVLVMPTTPFKAPRLPPGDCNVTDYLKQTLHMAANTAPFNLTGHPALTVNAGYSEGLPVGVMVVGRKFQDATVLNVGYALENIAKSETCKHG